jgi:hypothetical protein
MSSLLYQPRMMMDDDECGAIGEMIGMGSRSTRRKPAPVLLCSPQIPQDFARARTQAAAVGSRRLRPGPHERCVDGRCNARRCVRCSLTSHYTDGTTRPTCVDRSARCNAHCIFDFLGHATTDVRSCAVRCSVTQSALELFTRPLV